MKRFVWGLVLSALGGMAVLGSLLPGGDGQGLAGGVLFLAGGTVLARFGWRAVTTRKAAAELALRQIRASGVIDAAALAVELRIAEVDVRAFVLDAQRRGLVPLQAEIV